MSSEDDFDPDDGTREWLRQLRETTAVPRDVVPGEGLTIEDLRRMNDATGTWSEVTQPGEVIEDADGIPTGVGPTITQTVYFGGVWITRADVDRLGIDPDDFPNVVVMPNPTRRSNRNEH